MYSFIDLKLLMNRNAFLNNEYFLLESIIGCPKGTFGKTVRNNVQRTCMGISVKRNVTAKETSSAIMYMGA